MKETDIQQLIRIEASKHGFRLWCNHVGGREDGEGRFHKFGLCKGSSDLIGISPDGRFVMRGFIPYERNKYPATHKD